MRSKFLSLLSIPLFISCGYSPRETVEVEFKKFDMEGSSIRAIEVINDSTVAYAGSAGDFGVISGGKKIKLGHKIITDSIVPHFRALTYTADAMFAISIGNPALLYRYKNKKIDIVYKEEHEKVFYDAIKFWDKDSGIAIGDPTENCLSILITRNGGKAWGKIPCEYLPKTEDGEAAFAASNTNIAIVKDHAWVVTGGKKARVFHTADKGITWEVFDTPILQGKASEGIYSVDFYNRKKGIICGGDYTDKFGNSANKAITNDGGKTWEVIAENNSPKYVSCVQYVPWGNGEELFAVSTNGVFYTNNEGKSWEKVSDESFYSIRIKDKNNAWVSGENVVAKMTIK
ncbi:oxidoreductase [Lutibacter sp. TH_r2]|uniref:WD40/YVTN/BNR-like repeat-containing protein n=1 Tax=Lutibacter sp. TH_r2 TaxID=3082083 RepID=UPI0029559C8C|nr:oxidoreductase [Lutibacter sp. TH_r2]MDV7188280.1 oxidoreductase [Lutibacter sp. TH_r2]